MPQRRRILFQAVIALVASVSLAAGGVAAAAVADPGDPGDTPVGDFVGFTSAPDPSGRTASGYFEHVTQAGITTVTRSTSGPEAVGFVNQDPDHAVWTVHTTAVVEGQARICLPDDDPTVYELQSSPDQVWSYTSGSWQALGRGNVRDGICADISVDTPLVVGGPQRGGTAVGQHVRATVQTPFSVVFDSVVAPGVTTLSQSGSDFTVATTAEFTGLVRFCVQEVHLDPDLGDYDGQFRYRAMAASVIRLYQLQGGVWRDITTSEGNGPCGASSTLDPLRTGGPGAVTPVGPDVYVPTQLVDSHSESHLVHFGAVSTAGTTTSSDSATGPAPDTFTVGTSPVYVTIGTTASFSGGISLCLQSQVSDESGFSDYSIQHLYLYAGGTWQRLPGQGDDRTGNVCGSASTTGIFAVGQELPGATDVGPNQYLEIYEADGPHWVDLHFDAVTSSGITSFTTSSSGPASSGFSLLESPPLYFEITSTATFTGTTRVCVTFDSSGITDDNFLTQRLYHYEGGAWVDVTTGNQYSEVCGDVTSLSPFVVGYPLPAGFTTIGTPTVGGAAAVGSTLAASPGAWEPAPDSFDYQWNRGGIPIVGATSPSYAVVDADRGSSLSVTVTAVKEGYPSASASSAPTAVVPTLPALTAPVPTVTGTAQVGSQLTGVVGVWGPGTVTKTYAWTRDGVAIPGAVSTKYTLVAADLGTSVAFRVSGTKSGYAPSTTTSVGVAVAAGVLTATPVPSITGTPQVGSKLTAVAGTWSPASVAKTYQWSKDGAAIAGATASTYTIAAVDVGGAIAVSVTGSRAGFTSVTRTSDPVSVASGILTPSPTPTVTGTAEIGLALTAVPGTWGPGTVTKAYQWQRDGVDIAGATLTKYTLVAADLGASVTVTVTGSRAGFTSQSRTSAAVVPVAGVLTATPTPTITGTLSVGKTLTAHAGTWKPSPVALSYQWLRNGVPIPGGAAPSYVLAGADLGVEITVAVTGSRAGFTSVTTTSIETTPIAAGTLVGAVPTISGTVKAGSVLTAAPGAWTPAPDAFGYKWLRDGAPIAGATSASYLLGSADVGHKISVITTASALGYNALAKTSASTAKVVP